MKKNLQILIFFVAVCLVFNSIELISAQDNKNPLTENLYQSAESDLEAGNFDAAIAEYNKIIMLDARNPNAYQGRGNAYLGKGDYDRAIADFTKNIELKSDDYLAYYGRGKAYFKKGDYENSIADHTKELELDPTHDLGRLERGNAWLNSHQTDRAFQDYHRVIAFSRLRAGFYARGAAFQVKGEKAAAIGDLRYYLDQVPDDSKVRNSLITLGVNPGELPPALISKNISTAAKQALRKVFDDIEQAYYDEAIWALTKIIRTDPKIAAAYFYRGYVLQLQASARNADKVKADYTKAIMTDPKFVEAYLSRAWLAFFKHDVAGARADVSHALTLDPKSARAVYYRAIFYYGDDWAKQLSDLNLALKLNPNFADVYFGRGLSFEVKKQHDQAITDYSAVIKINPNDILAYDRRAKVYCLQNKKDLAAADEKKVVELGDKIDVPCSAK